MELGQHRHFKHHYKGFWGTESKCYVDIFQLEKRTEHGHDTIVLFSALQDNEGTSITNASEFIATDIVVKYGVNVPSTLFVETYPYNYDRDGERYDAVFYKYDMAQRKFHSPEWKPLNKLDENYVDFIKEHKSEYPLDRAE
jgi:hypothetical protein